MNPSRQLAVVMFTDIVGYTAMMQNDETLALKKLNHFKTAINKEVPGFNGEIIQYYGDGALMIFSNSTDAVCCGSALQENFAVEPVIPVRIGIHLGDILREEGNIFGDCVNVTSRIESMGFPGSVLISASVQQQLKNKSGFKLCSLGEFEFKNVDDPIQIFALMIGDSPVPNREDIAGKFREHKSIRSIAVLPFVNMSNDREQEYFSDGIAEEIINSLSHLKDLDVAGRTSAFQFKEKNIDLREIGKKLGVQCVLEGSVRKQANRLRISAQLIDVENGYHLWSERYDREITDVFAIQDEIAFAITEKLRITLQQKDRAKISKVYTQNTEAYELYLKGRFFMSRRGISLLQSMQCFQKAIELDPEFALAHSAFADNNLLIATYGLLPPEKVMTVAKKSAEKALELDPGLCQPYCVLGYYYTCCEWNWKEGKNNFLRAIEINPRYAEGHFRYGWNYLACVEGNFDEAEKHGATAIKLEPLSSICYATHSLILHSAGKFTEALEICKTGIELDANSFVCHLNAGSIYLALKQYDDAILSYETAMHLANNRHHFIINALIWVYCLKGDVDKATQLMKELKERSATEYISKTFTGLSAAYLNDIDGSINYLKKAIEDKDPILVMLKHEPWVPVLLENDDRFNELMKQIGFP
ncbi:MAG: adenylate/guanylate cyclase domain-containing protein [Ferruginibacter sp.]